MHIVTGLLLTTLLGRNRGTSRLRLPSFPGVLETAHALPGRLRFRVPAIRGHREAAAEVQARLQRLEGVNTAEVSQTTGSVLLTYRQAVVEPELLFAGVVRLLGLDQQIKKTPRSRVARELRDAGEALNRAVHARTGGVIDLWTALPLVLVVLGVRNLASRHSQMGWPLLWWAYLALFPPAPNEG